MDEKQDPKPTPPTQQMKHIKLSKNVWIYDQIRCKATLLTLEISWIRCICVCFSFQKKRKSDICEIAVIYFHEPSSKSTECVLRKHEKSMKITKNDSISSCFFDSIFTFSAKCQKIKTQTFWRKFLNRNEKTQKTTSLMKY